jgi:hypothetical protein
MFPAPLRSNSTDHRKHRFKELLYYCVLIRCCRNLFLRNRYLVMGLHATILKFMWGKRCDDANCGHLIQHGNQCRDLMNTAVNLQRTWLAEKIIISRRMIRSLELYYVCRAVNIKRKWTLRYIILVERILTIWTLIPCPAQATWFILRIQSTLLAQSDGTDATVLGKCTSAFARWIVNRLQSRRTFGSFTSLPPKRHLDSEWLRFHIPKIRLLISIGRTLDYSPVKFREMPNINTNKIGTVEMWVANKTEENEDICCYSGTKFHSTVEALFNLHNAVVSCRSV